jgi:hypothetical protein
MTTRWARTLRRLLTWALGAALVVIALLLMPIGYVELACRGELTSQPYRSLVDAPHQRREANTYLTYPEWHIVYAYDGLAATLADGDEYQFNYAQSVTGFWRSACALMRVADAHGGADAATRSMIHIIGASFTAEMAVKAAYEDTIGRATAWLRGAGKTPQDEAIAAVARDYAAFLRQTPWYGYPFTRAAGQLWDAPIDGALRGWERRLGIGAEFLGKAAYAKVLGAAAAAAPAELTIRSVVSGMDRTALAAVPGVTVIGPQGGGFEIETPRYDLFTRILAAIARGGGQVREIGGNDDIMVSITVPDGAYHDGGPGVVILRMPRSGVAGERLLIDLKVSDLARFMIGRPLGDPGLEHVFDY